MAELGHPVPGARITQYFGENPSRYKQFDLAGHDGLDFSAVVGTSVLAPDSGRAWIHYESAGYGKYLTIHGRDYVTYLCHLSVALINDGQSVTRGQIVALSGNTGYSTDPHLHITVRPVVADLANGYKGRIDPYPLIFGVQMSNTVWGWHGGNSSPITADERFALDSSPLGVFVFLPWRPDNSESYNPGVIRDLVVKHPDCHFIMRPYFHPPRLGPERAYEREMPLYYDECCRDLDRYAGLIPAGQLHLQIFNEPNMPGWALWQGYGEGFGESYESMLRFNECFCDGYKYIKQRFDNVQIGFTPLAIANYDMYYDGYQTGVSFYMHGPEASHLNASADDITSAIASGPCYEALSLADEYYAHIYLHWSPGAWCDPYYGRRIERYVKFLPKPMDVWVTEAGIPRASNWASWTMDSITRWLRSDSLRSCGVKGAALWILGNNSEWGGIWENRRSDVESLISALTESPSPAVPPAVDLAPLTESDLAQGRGLVYKLNGATKACARKGYADLGVGIESKDSNYLITLAMDPTTKRVLTCKIYMPTWTIVSETEVVV